MYVPDGWFKYSRFSTPIGETKIIAVKTPLKQAFNNGKYRGEVPLEQLDQRGGVPIEEEFTPTQMVERLKTAGWNLKAVIDLTFTSRYYNPKEFKDDGVQHSKIFCPGHEIPNDEVYSQFAASLSDYLASCEDGDLVAVHCTHGLNRTGYLVCRFLIDRRQFSPENAIQAFNEARGYDIERENYLNHLKKGCPPLPPPQQHPNQVHRKGDQGQGHYRHRDASHSSCSWEPRQHNASDHQNRLPPPQRYFERRAEGEDQREDAADHLTETETHKRKKKRQRKKRQSSREPLQPDHGPIPLFPDHSSQPSSLELTPVPLFPDQDRISHEPLQPDLDFIPLFPDHSSQPSSLSPSPIPVYPDQDQIQPQHDDRYRQNSYEMRERACTKYSRQNERRQSRKRSPYGSPAAMPARTGSRSSKRDRSFTNDASHLAGSCALSDCTGPEGLSSENRSHWKLTRSRGMTRWDRNEREHSHPVGVDQSLGRDWRRSSSH